MRSFEPTDLLPKFLMVQGRKAVAPNCTVWLSKCGVSNSGASMAAKKGEKRDHHLHVGKGFHFCFSIFHKSSFSSKKKETRAGSNISFHSLFVAWIFDLCNSKRTKTNTVCMSYSRFFAKRRRDKGRRRTILVLFSDIGMEHRLRCFAAHQCCKQRLGKMVLCRQQHQIRRGIRGGSHFSYSYFRKEKGSWRCKIKYHLTIAHKKRVCSRQLGDFGNSAHFQNLSLW